MVVGIYGLTEIPCSVKLLLVELPTPASDMNTCFQTTNGEIYSRRYCFAQCSPFATFCSTKCAKACSIGPPKYCNSFLRHALPLWRGRLRVNELVVYCMSLRGIAAGPQPPGGFSNDNHGMHVCGAVVCLRHGGRSGRNLGIVVYCFAAIADTAFSIILV